MLKFQYLTIIYILNVLGHVFGTPVGGDKFGKTWSSSGASAGGFAKAMSSQSSSFASSSSQSSSFGSSSSAFSSAGAGSSQSHSSGLNLGSLADGGAKLSTSIKSGISSSIGGNTGIIGSLSIDSGGINALSNDAGSLSRSKSLKSSFLDTTNDVSSKVFSGSLIDHEVSKVGSSRSDLAGQKSDKNIGINVNVGISKTIGRRVQSDGSAYTNSVTENNNRNIGTNINEADSNDGKRKNVVNGRGSGRSDGFTSSSLRSRSSQSTSVQRQPGKSTGIKVKFDIDTSKNAGGVTSKSGSKSDVTSSALSAGVGTNKSERKNDARRLSGSNSGGNGRTSVRTGTVRSSSSGSSGISSSKHDAESRTSKTDDLGFQVNVDVSGGKRGVIEVNDDFDKSSSTGISSSHTIDGSTGQNSGINIKGALAAGRSVLVSGDIEYENGQSPKLDAVSEVGNIDFGLPQSTQHGGGATGNFEIELNNGISAENTGIINRDFQRFGSIDDILGAAKSDLRSLGFKAKGGFSIDGSSGLRGIGQFEKSRSFETSGGSAGRSLGFKAKGGFSIDGSSGLRGIGQFEKSRSFETSGGSAGSSKSFSLSSSHSSSFSAVGSGKLGRKQAGGKSNRKLNYGYN